MLMPKKHVRLSESILGLTGYILPYLKQKCSIDYLWKEVKLAQKSNDLTTKHTFDNLVLSIDFLYILGAIRCDIDGGIELETKET